MRKIFKLIFNEIKVMRFSTLLIILALILFTATLFSVLFVSLNFSESLFNHFDEMDYSVMLNLKNTPSNIPELNNSHVMYGHVDSYTQTKQIQNENGDVFETTQRTETMIDDKWVFNITSYTGQAFVPTQATLKYFESYKQYLVGEFPQSDHQICLCEEIAKALNVTTGDTVIINNEKFQISGIISNSFTGISSFLVCVKADTIFDNLYVYAATSAETYRLYTQLNFRGYSAEISNQQLIQSISTANIFFVATSVALFVVNLAIIYSMFSLILLNRRAYVCRLKVLGCNSRTIFFVYFVLLILIVAAVELTAYALSSFVTAQILNLCTNLFDVAFLAKDNPFIVLAHFVLLGVILLLMTLLQVTKIRESTVVETMRGE